MTAPDRDLLAAVAEALSGFTGARTLPASKQRAQQGAKAALAAAARVLAERLRAAVVLPTDPAAVGLFAASDLVAGVAAMSAYSGWSDTATYAVRPGDVTWAVWGRYVLAPLPQCGAAEPEGDGNG